MLLVLKDRWRAGLFVALVADSNGARFTVHVVSFSPLQLTGLATPRFGISWPCRSSQKSVSYSTSATALPSTGLAKRPSFSAFGGVACDGADCTCASTSLGEAGVPLFLESIDKVTG